MEGLHFPLGHDALSVRRLISSRVQSCATQAEQSGGTNTALDDVQRPRTPGCSGASVCRLALCSRVDVRAIVLEARPWQSREAVRPGTAMCFT